MWLCETCSRRYRGPVELGFGVCAVCLKLQTMPDPPGKCGDAECPWFGGYWACAHGHANSGSVPQPKVSVGPAEYDTVARRLLSSVWPE